MGGNHVVFRVDPAAGYTVHAELVPATDGAELQVANSALGVGLGIRIRANGVVEVNGLRAGSCDPGNCRIGLVWDAGGGLLGYQVGDACSGAWPLDAPPDGIDVRAASVAFFSAVKR
jgi:hypothetical protein